jgi:hypothetical protein
MMSFRQLALVVTVQALVGFLIYWIVARRRFGRRAPRRVLEAARDGLAAAIEEGLRHPANRYVESLVERLHREDAEDRTRWEHEDLERFRREIGRRRVVLLLGTLLAAALPVALGILAYLSAQIDLMDTIAATDTERVTKELVTEGLRAAATHLSAGTRLGALVLAAGAATFLLSGELLTGPRRLQNDHAQLPAER